MYKEDKEKHTERFLSVLSIHADGICGSYMGILECELWYRHGPSEGGAGGRGERS